MDELALDAGEPLRDRLRATLAAFVGAVFFFMRSPSIPGSSRRTRHLTGQLTRDSWLHNNIFGAILITQHDLAFPTQSIHRQEYFISGEGRQIAE